MSNIVIKIYQYLKYHFILKVYKNEILTFFKFEKLSNNFLDYENISNIIK